MSDIILMNEIIYDFNENNMSPKIYLKKCNEKENKIYLEWKAFDKIMNKMASHINNMILDKSKSVVIGIARGGLVPMTTISNRLGIDYGIINYQTRDGKFNEPEILFDINKYEQYFIVEDIIDTGKTINNIVKSNEILRKKAVVYSIFRYIETNTLDENKVGFNAIYLKDKIWVVFPWE